MPVVDSSSRVSSVRPEADGQVVTSAARSEQPDLLSGLLAIESAHAPVRVAQVNEIPTSQPTPAASIKPFSNASSSLNIISVEPLVSAQRNTPAAVAARRVSESQVVNTETAKPILSPMAVLQRAPAAEVAAETQRSPVNDVFEPVLTPVPANRLHETPSHNVVMQPGSADQTPEIASRQFVPTPAASELPPPIAVAPEPTIAIIQPVPVVEPRMNPTLQPIAPERSVVVAIRPQPQPAQPPVQSTAAPHHQYSLAPPAQIEAPVPAPPSRDAQTAMSPPALGASKPNLPISEDAYRLELTPVDQWIDSSTANPSAPAQPPVTTFVIAGVRRPESMAPPATTRAGIQVMPEANATIPNTLAPGQMMDTNGLSFASLPSITASLERDGCSPLGCPYLPGQSGAEYACGVDCGRYGAPCNSTWSDSQCIPWSLFGPGEYVGPARPAHTAAYYLRVNDLITLTFITSRKKEAERYRLGPGDRLKVEWLRAAGNNDAVLDREVMVQPDGTIPMPLVGDIIVAGKTVADLRTEMVESFGRFQRDPQITVTPLDVNQAHREILNAVSTSLGSNGQSQQLRVTPEGTIQAPGLGSVYVQGLTLEELRSELEARYAATFGAGLLISPALTERATSYVFVGGEVRTPNRYVLEGPTTVMQAIAMSGGWNIGGNLRQVVVFRRDENWCLKAIKIDVRAPLYGNDPCPANDVWLRDNDLVIVPKSKILCATDVIDLYFTRGVYAVFPISYVHSFSNGSPAFIP